MGTTQNVSFFVEQVLPHLSLGATPVMDNAPIHWTVQVHMQHLAAIRGIDIIFLPPSSPGLNPIELFFKSVKGELRGPNSASFGLATFPGVLSCAAQ